MVRYDDDIAPHEHELFVVKHLYDKLRPDLYGYGDFECLASNGQKVIVDLFVSGDLDEFIQPDDLIGKKVIVDYTHAYVWIAQNVRITK